ACRTLTGSRWRYCLRADRSKLRLRSVDAENIAGASARVVNIADAEAAVDDGLFIGRIGKADARSEVGEIGVNQRAAVHSAGLHRRNSIACNGTGSDGEHSLRNGIEAR